MSKSAHDTITVTDLVRNLSVVIDKVRITGQSLYVTKGSQTVAELTPPPKSGLPISQLLGLLKSLPKLGDDGSALRNDLEHIRRRGKIPENPWA